MAGQPPTATLDIPADLKVDHPMPPSSGRAGELCDIAAARPPNSFNQTEGFTECRVFATVAVEQQAGTKTAGAVWLD